MAYGVVLNNNKGEEIVDFNAALYRKKSGAIRLLSTIMAESDALATAAGISNNTPGDYWRNYVAHTAALANHDESSSSGVKPRLVAGVGKIIVSGDFCLCHPELFAKPDDLIFLKPGTTGFSHFVTCNFDGSYMTEVPTGSFAVVESKGALDYVIASTDATGLTAEGTHGLQIKDEAGLVTYDSRYPQFSIFHHTIVSKTVLDNILLNDAVFDITLPKAAANCYVSCPYHASFVQWSGGYYICGVNIAQINSTTIRLSRTLKNTGTTSWSRIFTQDLIMFFARTA